MWVAISHPIGRCLLLVHGMAGSSATWKAVLPALARRYTVVAPTFPATASPTSRGTTTRSAPTPTSLRDLMIALGIERATVVGQSLGGGVAMQLAYQHPQRCERLVLVSSGGLGPEVSWMLRALTLPGAEYLMPVLFPGFVRDAGNAVGRRLARFGIRGAHVEQEWRAYMSLTEPENRQSFVRTLRAVVDPAARAVSAHDRLYLASRLPTLIVWGRATGSSRSATPGGPRGDPRQPAGDLREVGPLPPRRGARPASSTCSSFVDGNRTARARRATRGRPCSRRAHLRPRSCGSGRGESRRAGAGCRCGGCCASTRPAGELVGPERGSSSSKRTRISSRARLAPRQ